MVLYKALRPLALLYALPLDLALYMVMSHMMPLYVVPRFVAPTY